MRCRDLMKTDVVSCRHDDPVWKVAKRMSQYGIGFLPVCDGQRKLVGVVTDRDLTCRVLARQLDFATPVQLAMTSEPITCKALDPLSVAEQRMARGHKSRIPIVDDFGECIGVISLSDIAHADTAAASGQLLSEVTERETHSTVH